MISSLLIIRPGAVGDFIVSLPALQYLSSQAAFTEVWCAEFNLPLVQFAPIKRSIISAGLDRVGVMHCDDVWRRLSQFEAIHSWYGAARPEFRDLVRALPFHFHEALPHRAREHATEFYCGQTGAAVRAPTIAVPSTGRGNFFVIHPFASNREKQWPMEHFRSLAKALGKVRWCAGPEDVARNPGAIEDPVVINDLFELGKWVSTARAYVGNDSGITHLAAAVGTPVVALFGPTDPAVWAPRGERVRVLSCASTPQQVAAAVYDLL